MYVIEVNPRGSRTVPFLSKVTGVPMVDLAVRVGLGTRLVELGFGTGLWPAQPLVAAKAPVFSMSKLTQVDTYLGPEMKSTGEVMGLGETVDRGAGQGAARGGQRPAATWLGGAAVARRPRQSRSDAAVSALARPGLRPAGDRGHRRTHPRRARRARRHCDQEAQRRPPERARRDRLAVACRPSSTPSPATAGRCGTDFSFAAPLPSGASRASPAWIRCAPRSTASASRRTARVRTVDEYRARAPRVPKRAPVECTVRAPVPVGTYSWELAAMDSASIASHPRSGFYSRRRGEASSIAS